jgi:site-specific DNA recombinase
MARVAAYLRRSSPGEDDKNYSIENQLSDIRTWASEHGHEVGPVYSDPGGRSYTLNRPVFQQMLADARASEFDIVCVGRFDRFSRIQVQCTVAIYQFREAGVEVSSATEPLPEGAVGEFVRNGIIFAAETELGNIRARTYGGKRSRVHSGKLPPSPWPKYGYQYADDKKERYVPNPETAPIVQRIFNEYAAGATIRRLETKLTNEGIPTPFMVLEKMGRSAAKRGGEAEWFGSTIFTILTNRAYIGKLVGFRTKYETKTMIHPITGERRTTRVRVARSPDDPESFAYGPDVCPPLVSDELFAAVQERLRINKERASRNTKHPADILLRSGLVRCGYCGGYCVPVWNVTGQVHRYSCNARQHHKRNCTAPTRFSVLVKTLDKAVWDWFIEQLSHPELIAAAYESYRNDVGMLTGQRDQELNATKAALKDAQDEEESYLAAVGSARSDAMRARFVSLAEDAHDRLMELEGSLAKLELGVQKQEQDMSVIKAFAEAAPQAVERLKNASIEDKREALYRCKVQVTLWEKEHDPHWKITWMRDFVHIHL